MSPFSDKIFSIVYGAIFGLGFGGLVASALGSYILGTLVGTVVFVFARRFWVFCDKSNSNRHSTGQVHTSVSDGPGKGTFELSPTFYNPTCGSPYQNTYGQFDSSSKW